MNDTCVWFLFGKCTAIIAVSTLNVSITVDDDVNDLICCVVHAIQFFEIRHSSPWRYDNDDIDSYFYAQS